MSLVERLHPAGGASDLLFRGRGGGTRPAPLRGSWSGCVFEVFRASEQPPPCSHLKAAVRDGPGCADTLRGELRRGAATAAGLRLQAIPLRKPSHQHRFTRPDSRSAPPLRTPGTPQGDLRPLRGRTAQRQGPIILDRPSQSPLSASLCTTDSLIWKRESTVPALPASSDNSPTTGNNARAFVQFCWKRSAKRRASGAPATVPPAGSISAGRRAAASSILVTWTTSPSRTTSSNPRPGLESAPQSLAPRPPCAALSNACVCWQEACDAGARICLITNSLPRIRASCSTPVVRDPG